MKRISILISLLTFCLLGTQAQIKLERQVIASTGNYSTSANLRLSSTAGEAASTSLINGSFRLTQGFQQPTTDEITDIDVSEALLVNYQIYPNPTVDRLTVDSRIGKLSDLSQAYCLP